MSFLEDARVVVMVADYVGVDAANKVNIIGGGFLLAGISNTGSTAPQHVMIIVTAPGRHAGREVNLSLELRNADTNTVVQLPGPTGQPEALRISQNLRFLRTDLPGTHVPEDVPTQLQFVMAFPTGLPLAAQHTYEWRVELDGHRRQGWSASFYVPAPSLPVFGGPTDPAHPSSFPSTVIDDPLEGGGSS